MRIVGILDGEGTGEGMTDGEPPPLPGYDALAARDVMRAILDLTARDLTAVHAYEERHRRRSHVLAAIRRALARLARR